MQGITLYFHGFWLGFWASFELRSHVRCCIFLSFCNWLLHEHFICFWGSQNKYLCFFRCDQGRNVIILDCFFQISALSFTWLLSFEEVWTNNCHTIDSLHVFCLAVVSKVDRRCDCVSLRIFIHISWFYQGCQYDLKTEGLWVLVWKLGGCGLVGLGLKIGVLWVLKIQKPETRSTGLRVSSSEITTFIKCSHPIFL